MENAELKSRELAIREKELDLKEKELDNNLKIAIIENFNLTKTELYLATEENKNFFSKIFAHIKGL